MILLPAIDIRGGRAVRLRQGDFADETVYADDPLHAARDWVEAGARWLHVVDLDGARSGAPTALGHLARIATEAGAPVQYGGGLRTAEAVEEALAAGARRVVLGTAALRDAGFLGQVLERHGDRVAVAVDARSGEVSVDGWTRSAGERAAAAVGRLVGAGAGWIVYTAVDRDGMMAGPDLEALQAVAEAVRGHARLLYSGGIGELDHLRSIGALRLEALTGAIAGKALYELRFTVAEGQAALDEAVSLH